MNLPLEQLAQAAAEALPDAAQELYVYGGRPEESAQAAQALCDLGYSAVYDLGSLADWPYETITTEKENAPFWACSPLRISTAIPWTKRCLRITSSR